MAGSKFTSLCEATREDRQPKCQSIWTRLPPGGYQNQAPSPPAESWHPTGPGTPSGSASCRRASSSKVRRGLLCIQFDPCADLRSARIPTPTKHTPVINVTNSTEATHKAKKMPSGQWPNNFIAFPTMPTTNQSNTKLIAPGHGAPSRIGIESTRITPPITIKRTPRLFVGPRRLFRWAC